MAYIRLYDDVECDKCYSISGTVNSLAGSTETITFGIVDWALVFSGQPLTALANILVTQTLEFSSTGAFSTTFDMECIPFIQGTQLRPNIIVWDDNDIDIEIDELIVTEACQTFLCSECISLKEEMCESGLLIEYRHSSNAYGFVYPPNIKHTLLIEGIISPIDYQYPVEEVHKDGQGNMYPIKTEIEEVSEMRTGMLADYVHFAIAVALKHDELTINGKPYFKPQGNYTPELDDPIEDYRSQSKTEVIALPQNLFGDYC